MSFKAGFMQGYLDPLQVRDRIEDLARRFPELCRQETLPFETHGYWGDRQDARGRQKMTVLHVTSPRGPQTKPAVLLMRSPHAREWINAIAAVEAALQLVENYRPDDRDPRVQETVKLLDEVVFMIVPEGNPDGALSTFFDGGRRMWRKTCVQARAAASASTATGITRNISARPARRRIRCTEIYHGPQALSEPESANIADLVMRHRNILFAIDSHSSGDAIFRPNARGGTHISQMPVDPQDEAIYQNLELSMNRLIRLVKGIEYSTGSTSNHAGTSDEYFFFVHRIYGFDLECGSDFQPPVADALISAAEVVQATRGLGLCAAGMTGLDIERLLAQRRSYDVRPDAMPNVVPPTADLAEAAPPAIAPDARRQFKVRVEPRRPDTLVSEGLALLEAGLDVDEDFHEGLSLIASAQDLRLLVQKGYRPVVVGDIEAT